MQLPLTSRELTRQTRRRGIYAARMLAPGFVSVALAFMLVFTQDVRPETVGRVCFFIALAFQYGVVFLAAPLMTADLIAREKEERTLPLLLLANARALDIVISKYFSVLLICELLILSTLPLVAFAGFFGGVDIGSGAAATLLNMATAAAFAALGMLASALAHQPRVALWIAYLFIALYAGADQFISPGSPARYEGDIPALWRHLEPAFALAASILTAALLAAGWFVGHELFGRAWPMNGRAPRRIPPRPPEGSTHALRVLVARSGPVRGAGHRILLAVLLVSITVACFVIGQITLPLLIAAVAYQTASSTRDLVRSGALDDLRLLPVDRWQLGDAVFQKHFLAALFLIPAFALAGAKTGGAFGGPLIATVKVVAVAILAVALIRYTVALASERATVTRPAILSVFVLGRVCVVTLIATLLASAILGLMATSILWFRFATAPSWAPTLAGGFYFLLWFVLFGMFTRSARDPRLRFAQQLERDLFSAGQ